MPGAVDTMAGVAVGHTEPESVEIIQPRTYKPSLAGAGLQNTLTSRTLTNKKRGGRRQEVYHSIAHQLEFLRRQ